MVRCFLFFFLLLMCSVARAQTATATLDSTRIAVGSATTLTLEVHAPQGTAVQWPTLPDSLGGGLEILSRGKVDTARGAGEVVYRQQAQLTGFDSGVFEVPVFAFPTDGGVLETAPVPLLVQTLQVDTAQPFRPIKDILEVPGSWLDAWPYLLAGLVLIGVVLFILLRKKSPRPAKPRAAEGAGAAALRAFAELEKSGLLERGAMGESFTRASDILRRYLEARFSIAALEEPTDAMLRSIQQHKTLQVHGGVLREFFITADLAKFAKATPTLSEAKGALDSARAFIQQTDGSRKSAR